MNEKSSYNSLAEKLEDFSQGSSSYYFSKSNDTIVTTEDKLFRILTRHQKDLENNNSWVAPLGILATAIGTLVGVDQYRSFWGISAIGLQGFFLFLLAFCIVWFVRCREALFKHFGATEDDSDIDQLIKKIKEESEEWQHASGGKERGSNGLTLSDLVSFNSDVIRQPPPNDTHTNDQ